MQSSLRSEGTAILGTALRGSGATYYIQEVIGEGGQGWVFKASYDDLEGFPVVVKILRPDGATKDAFDRFQREADILRRLSQNNPSPYIVRFFDSGEASFPLPTAPGEHAQLPYIVLEYVHGESLFDVLERQRGMGLSITRARRIAREVAKALEIVHAQGVVHRDLKPSNILLASEAGREVAKVTDFGLVKIVDLRATATAAVAGVSLSYAPPEQYEPGNPRVGPHTDVFSFGAIIFEILCGREAFPSTRSNPFEALRLIATSKRPKLFERVSSLPLGLKERLDLVQRIDVELERAMQAEPQDRHRTVAELWDAVEPLLREADGKAEITGKMFAAGPTLPAGQAPQMSPPQISPPQMPLPAPAVTPAATPMAMRREQTPRAPVASGVRSMEAPPRASGVDPNDPRSWSWRLLSPGAPGARVRDGIVDDALQSIVTVGSAGLVRWAPGVGWQAVQLGFGMTPNELRSIGKLPNGAVAIGGERGLLAILHGGTLWDVRRYPEADVAFHGVASDVTGARIVAVGERVSRGHAFVAELSQQGWLRTYDLADVGPLRSVAFYDPQVVFACGDGGGLVRLDEQGIARVPWARTGHLRAIAAHRAMNLVVAVGTGGHALGISPAPPPATTASIEKVMTTQDLLGVTIGTDGAAWATSANARVLRRDAAGSWRRVTTDFPVPSNLLRIASLGDRVLVLADDAAVVEGQLQR